MPFFRRHLLTTILIAAALIYAVSRFFSTPGSGDALARVGSTVFKRSDVDPTTQRRIEFMEFERHAVLERTAAGWLENQVLEREAAAQGVGINQLLEKEVFKTVSVTDADVEAVYAASPAATAMPYESALDRIREHLINDRLAQAKKSYLAALEKKYSAKLLLKNPDGYVRYVAGKQNPFPAFVPPAARPSVHNGSVVAPPYKGGASAGTVLIEVFSDFMCPYSAKFAKTLDEVLPAYGDKVRVEYRHLPLAFHQGADKLAEASACALEQGKFWQFHDAQYAQPGGWDAERVRGLARTAGADAGKLIACAESGKYRGLVQNDLREAATRGAKGTPSFFVNGRFVSGAVPAATLKSIIDWTLEPKGKFPVSPAPQAPAGAERPAQQPQQAVHAEFSADDLAGSPSRGPANAPVTIVEFIDFQCPFCKKGAENVSAAVGSRSDVRLVSKQFPLPMHAEAAAIAESALCANEQGKYWEFRDKMFAAMGKKTDQEIREVAGSAGADLQKFDACRASKKHAATVKKDVELGSAKGVRGTPAYFINGALTSGALPVETFVRSIDEAKKKTAAK